MLNAHDPHGRDNVQHLVQQLRTFLYNHPLICVGRWKVKTKLAICGESSTNEEGVWGEVNSLKVGVGKDTGFGSIRSRKWRLH